MMSDFEKGFTCKRCGEDAEYDELMAGLVVVTCPICEICEIWSDQQPMLLEPLEHFNWGLVSPVAQC
jgi:hypothetical protein